MGICITCLPNGTVSAKTYIKDLKERKIDAWVYRLNATSDWQVCKAKSFKFIAKKHAKNKKFEKFHVSEFNEKPSKVEPETLENDNKQP